jgi:folate-binding protein YgfZ
MKHIESIGLEDLGVVRLRGADVVRFLQGQLSNDVARLGAATSQLAGYHNPQGRAIALLRLVHLEENDLLAVLPRELASAVETKLSKFILRAKVKIGEESSSWRVSGLAQTASGSISLPETDLPSALHAQRRHGDSVFVRVGNEPARWLLISPASGAGALSGDAARLVDSPTGERETWRRLDVAAGQPQIYASTTEEFVAQMLNLDVIDAVAFDKGCYTGQEVIARAHYRGRVKRRLQRFTTREAHRLAPGDTGRLDDGRAFKVVEAARLADGRYDFLAVAPLASGEPGATAEAGPNATAPTTDTNATITVRADQAALPYPLPD